MIECICEYNHASLRRIASKARGEGNFRQIMGSYGIKSMIVMKDGFIMLTPLRTNVYYDKLKDKSKYLEVDSKRMVIAKDIIREITMKPNRGQKRDIVKARAEERYFNRCNYKKRRRYCIFTTTGRVYAVPLIREDLENETG